MASARKVCACCGQTRREDIDLILTCANCGVARYCDKSHQRQDWVTTIAPGKPTGITRFLAHKFRCKLLKAFKDAAKGKAQTEECRQEMLNLLHKMANWKGPHPAPSTGDDDTWWTTAQEDDEAAGVGLLGSKGDAQEAGAECTSDGTRKGGEFKEKDVVQLQSLQTEAFNGMFGTLQSFDAEAERWTVQLNMYKNAGKMIRVRSANLKFVRAPKKKPLPGNFECRQTLFKTENLYAKQDWQGIVLMEEEVMLTAEVMLASANGAQQDRAVESSLPRDSALFYYLGLAHEKLASELSAGSISEARKSFHVEKALESYQHELEFARKIGSRSEEAIACGNLANAYSMKGDFPRAFELADDALATFKELGDSVRAANACMNLAQFCDLPQVGQSGRKQEFIKTCQQMQAAMPPAVRQQWEASKRDPRHSTRRSLGQRR